jgi:pyruvate/2-oxoglutarate dehydrogenase complex dihydrolipoamide dehydrogenase (E3) component
VPMIHRDEAAHAAVQPLDEHNRRLRDNVHPPSWPNPEPADRYHLVVVGGGTAGLVTAAIGAALGARVALVERDLLGGDCLNVGCVPSKALIEAARGWHAARHAHERLFGPAADGTGDFPAVMERMRSIRADISSHDSAARFTELGVDVFLGEGRFTSRESVSVDGTPLRFRRAVIATGARAAVPPIPGLEESGYLTNETVFSLTALPARLAVIGGGPIGCELAQAFARFGSEVTLLEAGDRLLSNDDAEAAAVVAESLQRDGVRIVYGARVAGVSYGTGGRRIELEGDADGAVEADEILVAAGRAPNVAALNLEAAGVTYDRRKGVTTDERMRTSNHAIFAIGDVASKLQFTHAADAQARMVIRNALFHGRSKKSDLIVPWCTYTQPELAHVGIDAAAVSERGADVETLTIPLDSLDRARLAGETDGFLRLHLERGSDTILGATMVGPHAGEIISQVTQAMVTGTGLSKLGEVVFPYPTLAEAVRKAADQYGRRRLTPLARRVFGLWFRLTA